MDLHAGVFQRYGKGVRLTACTENSGYVYLMSAALMSDRQ
jgi:hypothetical protein